MTNTINNFDIFEHLLHFESDDEFYLGQIIRRKKDGNEEAGRDCVVKSFYIGGVEYYKKIQSDVITLCDMYNARFYINPSVKSKKRATLEMLKIVTDRIYSNNFNGIQNIADSAAGKIGSARPVWVLDIDWDDYPVENLPYFISTLERVAPYDKQKLIEQIPTRNGIHLLTHPFNVKEYVENFPWNKLGSADTLIHKNNPTLIYLS